MAEQRRPDADPTDRQPTDPDPAEHGTEGRPAAAAPLDLAVEEDREAGFDELFARERRPMVQVAFLLVGSEAVAEEIVQDAFATVYERWARIDQPGAFLRRCVVNGAKRSLRRRALARRREPELIEGAVDHDARELLDALAQLPVRQRSVIVLRFYEHMTQPEIADALDLRLGTVKSSLHRGLARLREVIER